MTLTLIGAGERVGLRASLAIAPVRVRGPMRSRAFLSGLHDRLRPPTYLEVGVGRGGSLALARSAAIGIDPDYDLNVELGPETTLFKETSDEYFARPDPLEPIGGGAVSLAFIHGLPPLQYAFRDFINIERHAE